jgi:glutathione S-transferase
MRGYRWADDEAAFAAMRKKVPETMTACFRLIEREMFAGPWVMGAAYSICDPYLFTGSGWLESDGVNLADFPRVYGHHQRMAERPAVKRALSGELDAAATTT